MFKTLESVKRHLKDGGLFLFDCFNPNIQYIVEKEKGQTVIAEYKTDDGRNVLIKQTMRYESAGFNIIHKFGDFTGEVFDNDSEKQIYVLALKNMNTGI